MKKFLAIVLIISLSISLLLSYHPVYAQSQSDLEKQIAEYTAKLSELSGQKQTLSQALAVLNTQIKLTETKIAANVIQLDKLGAEITDLSGRISSLDYSLTDLTKLFISRIRQTYMRPGTYDALIISQTAGLSDAIRVIEYTKKVRDHDRSLLISLEKSRLDFNTQKQAKEQKQKEIEVIKRKLDADKIALASQIKSKNQLLTETKNSESQYQKLLADAKAQLAAFNRFTSGQGGASILNNTTRDDSGWGKYYNQRDSLWGNKALGISSISVAEAGCLITSMSMIMSYYGKSVNPGDISSNPSLFTAYYPYADFRQGDLNISGVNTNRTRIGYSQSSLDAELAKGKPVIVGVSPYGSVKPEHFVVVKRKEGDDYIINDPFVENGMNIKFSSHYTIASIRAVDRVSVY
jgi:peptidoglycan hydrolase CwlO-like protein